MCPRDISTAFILLVSVSLTACVRRDGRNSNCKWPEEASVKTLHPNQRFDAEHLRQDVEFAEELAVRYMDAHHAPRTPEEFNSQQASRDARNACLGVLMEQIGKSHDVPPSEVRRFLGRRSLKADAAVGLPFLVLYVFLAGTFVVRLLRRYPPEDAWSVTLALAILSSLAFGVGGMMVGEAWSGLAEGIRVGSGHLSYRVNRLPWVRHHIAAFVLCMLLFWSAAVARYWMRHQNK